MTRPRLLVVDDDESIRNYLVKFLATRGYDVESTHSGERAIARLKTPNRPAALLLDLMMPRMGGLEVLEELARLGHTIPTIVLSGSGEVNLVVKAIRLGAVNYLVKPFEDDDLERAVQNVLDENHGAGSPAPASEEHGEVPSVNKQMVKIREIAAQVADTDVPILILGESGVGKEVMARYIHRSSVRKTQPFVKVNCAALPADLLESELFGYERGAFTGALRDKPGKFELAEKGTILLDEIGEMSHGLQAKLLHVLQDGEFTRLGGVRASFAQARILAATNQRLEECVAKGTFREDLYYRLNVIRLEVPPLRQRREDIAPLCESLLEGYRIKYRRPARSMPPALMRALEHYSWPGNVRQLENVLKRFVILPDVELALGDLMEPQPAAASTPGQPAPPVEVAPPPRSNAAVSLKQVSAAAAERAEKEVVLRTLDELNWNRKQTARKLAISYKALLNKLRKWNIGGRVTEASEEPADSAR